MKFSAALFYQSPEEVRTRLGDRFNPATNYPCYTGTIGVPAAQVPELIEYLTSAQPNQRGEVPLKLSGWLRTSNSGTQYVSIAVEEDYKTKQAIEQARAAAPAPQAYPTAAPQPAPAAPAPSPFPGAVQQLATNFGGAVAVDNGDIPF